MEDLNEARIDKIPFCDICNTKGIKRKAKYDAKTKFGGWAFLCEEHFKLFGLGLGLGKGQKLIKP